MNRKQGDISTTNRLHNLKKESPDNPLEE